MLLAGIGDLAEDLRPYPFARNGRWRKVVPRHDKTQPCDPPNEQPFSAAPIVAYLIRMLDTWAGTASSGPWFGCPPSERKRCAAERRRPTAWLRTAAGAVRVADRAEAPRASQKRCCASWPWMTPPTPLDCDSNSPYRWPNGTARRIGHARTHRRQASRQAGLSTDSLEASMRSAQRPEHSRPCLRCLPVATCPRWVVGLHVRCPLALRQT